MPLHDRLPSRRLAQNTAVFRGASVQIDSATAGWVAPTAPGWTYVNDPASSTRTPTCLWSRKSIFFINHLDRWKLTTRYVDQLLVSSASCRIPSAEHMSKSCCLDASSEPSVLAQRAVEPQVAQCITIPTPDAKHYLSITGQEGRVHQHAEPQTVECQNCSSHGYSDPDGRLHDG